MEGIMELKEEIKKFVDWTKLKVRIHLKDKREFYFKDGEVWFASLGLNVGFEQNGKNQNFERPILVLKKFNKDILWAILMTSKEKDGDFFHKIKYEGDTGSIILPQLRKD